MKSHRLDNAVKCPACGADLTAAFPVDGDTDEGPRDGDASLCVDCRALLVYSGSPVVSLRYPTPEEERELLADASIQRAIAALAEVHRTRGNR